MRLFIAIQLSPDMRRALTDVQREFRRRNVQGSYAPEQNLHLTLAFLGEYDDPEAVAEALPPFEAFELSLQGVGAFGDLWWAGLERSQPLEQYVRRLRRALSEAGIPFDARRFRPHVTLVRRAAGQLPPVAPSARMTVRHISLMRSDRGKNGMLYTEIGGIESV